MNPSYSTAPWSLAELFPSHDGAEMQAAFDELERQVADFENRRQQLATEIPANLFMEIVRQLEAIHHLGYRIQGYASLAFAADTQSQAAQPFLASVEGKMAELGNRTLFFSLSWKELEQEEVAPLLAAAGDYRYWLGDAPLQAAYPVGTGREDHKPEEHHRRERIPKPVRCHHQSLCF